VAIMRPTVRPPRTWGDMETINFVVSIPVLCGVRQKAGGERHLIANAL
jgi:hypothetical protein